MKQNFVIAAFVMLALLAACKNSFVTGILPDNSGPGGKVTYTVTFDKNHNDASGWTEAEPRTMTVTSPATTIGSLPMPPTRSGYSFAGWNTEANGSGAAFSLYTPVTGNIKVFAKWEGGVPDPYTINIVIRGNVVGDSVTASRTTGKAGDVITLNYIITNANLHNLLVFSGTETGIVQADSAGIGTRTYTIAEADAAGGVITIIATFTHSDKAIDTIAFAGTGNVDKIYGDASFTRTAATGTGLGTITYSSSAVSVAAVDSAGQVTILKAGTATITATRGEDDTYAEITASYLLTVEKKPVSIIGLSAEDKVYNAALNVTITGTAAIDGKVGDDDVTVSAGTASFADKNVGSGKNITFSGYSLGGAAKDNYALSGQPAGVTADITALQLTIANPSVTTTKAYDGATTAAVTAGALTNKITGDTVDVSAAGAYNAATVAGANQITVVYTLSGADAGNYVKPANYTVPGTITIAPGSAVSVPTRASRTEDSITVNAVTLQSPALGQTAEYAIAEAASPVPGTGWRPELTFSGLTTGKTYYVFARATGNLENCDVGAAQVSAGIKTVSDDPDRKTVIDFEDDAIGKTYEFTRGQNSPTVKVATDPGNSGQKSLQITTANTSNSWNEAAIVPLYLPYALSNYESFSFRFMLLSGNTGTNLTERSIDVYVAANTADFKQGGFGNPADSPYTQFAANLVGSTPEEDFGEGHKNKWTEYEITCSPGPAISGLQGDIYIAIGINCQSAADYMLDDLTFLMKDSYIAPPTISPTTATFDKKAGTAGNVDITVTMALQEKTLTSITNNGTLLVENEHYTRSGENNKVVTLKTSYLGGLSVGTTTLTFTFSNGTAIPVTITVRDSATQTLAYTTNNFVLPTFAPNSGASASTNEAGNLVIDITAGYQKQVFILPFNFGTEVFGSSGTYKKIEVEIMQASGGGNDWNNKVFRAEIATSPTSGAPTYGFGAGDSSSNRVIAQTSGNISLGTSFPSSPYLLTIPSSYTGTLTGEVRVGFALYNTNPVRYEIRRIAFVP